MIWIWIILAVLYAVGVFASYDLFFRKWTDKSLAENVWYAVIWPLVAILYGIHWIHMKL